jgi:two-component system NarL family response regulator
MKLAIVEDRIDLLEYLRLLLNGEEGITVVGAYGSAEEALRGLRERKADLVLADLGLPGMDGVEMIERIKAEMPEIEVMVYSVFEDWENVFRALKAGASGYILKGTTPRELVEAIGNLYEGSAPMSPRIAGMVLVELRTRGPGERDESGGLSGREIEILEGLGRDRTHREIAADLGITPRTVRTHIKNIYNKLHAKGRTEAPPCG